MQKQKLIINDKLYQYLLKYGTNENAILQEIRHFTTSKYNPSQCRMQITIEQGQFMSLLAQIMHIKKYLEIGTFTGYSSMSIALATQHDTLVYTLDNNQEYLNITKHFFTKLNLNHKLIPIHGNALDSLAYLTNKTTELDSFDIIFIDANKNSYQQYFEYAYLLIKIGGIILIDNVLINGAVLDVNNNTDSKSNMLSYAKNIHQFNINLQNDKRVSISMLPIADGLTIAIKL